LPCVDKEAPALDGVMPPADDSTSASLALDVDIAKLSICEVTEPVAETAATVAASETHLLLAPFPQLQHLSLAQNKVCCCIQCFLLMFYPYFFIFSFYDLL